MIIRYVLFGATMYEAKSEMSSHATKSLGHKTAISDVLVLELYPNKWSRSKVNHIMCFEYRHKINTIAFTILSQTKRAKFHLSIANFVRVSLYVIYCSVNVHCWQCASGEK